MGRAAKAMLVLGFLVLAACGGACGGSSGQLSCPAGQHNSGSGVCVAVSTCSSGYHDGGDGTCTTSGVCLTGYLLAADGSCARTSACPMGTHDNGAGVCVTTITCPAGYHDGGSGTCVPISVCSSGYHDGGNGDCWIEGTCSSGYHNGGSGTCVPLVACSANYHDGGAGYCVPDGECASSYHNGGDGRCVTLNMCSAGYHDGGGGTCITFSGCLSGYRDDGTGLCVCRPSASAGLSQATCPCAARFHDDGAGKCVSTGCTLGFQDNGDGTCTRSATCVNGYYVDDTGGCVHMTDAAAGGSGAGGAGTGGVGGGSAGAGGSGFGGAVAGGSTTGRDAGTAGIGGSSRLDASIGSGGYSGAGGFHATGGASGSGGTTSTSPCGNGTIDPGKACDCGNDLNHLPSGCTSINGIFYGDGKGCSKTCTKEPTCLDSSGKTQACTQVCGDGNYNAGEECDDGNLLDGDGCSHDCKMESGFTCKTATFEDSSTCQSGTGQCLELSIIYRDFQPENVMSGGHPDFYFLGTKWNGSASPTTICVPNSSGPGKGMDSTERCWGIAADTLLNGKPQLGATTTCACQFSDWSISNSSRISGGYTQAGNDSPLSDGNGGFLGKTVGTAVNATNASGTSTGTLIGYTSGGGPIWKGTVPIVKDANSFKQWFSDDSTVNKTFTSVLELSSVGSDLYQYASDIHLLRGGFFPLDALNPTQGTLCNTWPYWRSDGRSRGCSDDQYLFYPRASQKDCASGDSVDDGCWVTGVKGEGHNYFFTSEARYYFVYDGSVGLYLQAYADTDLFIFINGQLVLDLGGVHLQLPGKVSVSGNPGDAKITEGGCLDSSANITGVKAGSHACSPTNSAAVSATTPDDFRIRTVALGLVTGNTYELAIFHANRSPVESDLQITLNGFMAKRSVCAPN